MISLIKCLFKIRVFFSSFSPRFASCDSIHSPLARAHAAIICYRRFSSTRILRFAILLPFWSDRIPYGRGDFIAAAAAVLLIIFFNQEKIVKLIVHFDRSNWCCALSLSSSFFCYLRYLHFLFGLTPLHPVWWKLVKTHVRKTKLHANYSNKLCIRLLMCRSLFVHVSKWMSEWVCL